MKKVPNWETLQILAKVKPDGYLGEETRRGVGNLLLSNHSATWQQIHDCLDSLAKSIPEENLMPAVKDSPLHTTVAQSYVRSQSSPFGHSGDEDNLVKVKVPDGYPMTYEGTPVKTIRIHKLVAPNLEKLLNLVWLDYKDLILSGKAPALCNYSGSYNDRSISSGHAKSMHSWGLAIDLDAENNAYKMNHTKARLAQPIYKKFWEHVKACGGYSLGQRSDCDWMHFQFASWD